MSKASDLLGVVHKISEQDDAAADMGATLDGAAAGSTGVNDSDELTQELIGYLNDQFDGDFAAVSSTFDSKQYKLTVEFSPEIPADADVEGIKADLADIFGADEADVVINTDSAVISNMFQQEDATDESLLDEAAPKMMKVIRGGVVVKKLVCPPGFKAQGGKCVKMNAAELVRRKKAGIKAARKGASKRGQAAAKRAKSMKKRTW